MTKLGLLKLELSRTQVLARLNELELDEGFFTALCNIVS